MEVKLSFRRQRWLVLLQLLKMYDWQTGRRDKQVSLLDAQRIAFAIIGVPTCILLVHICNGNKTKNAAGMDEQQNV
jgi:hypothetical protein